MDGDDLFDVFDEKPSLPPQLPAKKESDEKPSDTSKVELVEDEDSSKKRPASPVANDEQKKSQKGKEIS